MRKDPVDMDMSKPRKVVYDEIEAPDGLMIYSGAEQAWYDKGWVNTPAGFSKKVKVEKSAFDKKVEAVKFGKRHLDKLAADLEAKRQKLETKEAELAEREKKLETKEAELAEKVTAIPPVEPPPVTVDTFTDASDLSDYINKMYGLETNYRMGLKKLKEILQGKLDDNSSEDN